LEELFGCGFDFTLILTILGIRLGNIDRIGNGPGNELAPLIFGDKGIIPDPLNIPVIKVLHAIGNPIISILIEIGHIIDLLPHQIIGRLVLLLTRIHPKLAVHDQAEHAQIHLRQVLAVEAGPDVVADARLDIV
jgi:hypothetical protein